MRLLFVFRLYSSMATSVQEQRWQPFGLPDVYRLLEAVSSRGLPATVVFLGREEVAEDVVVGVTEFRFDGLDVDFVVIPAYRLPSLPGRRLVPQIISRRIARLYNDSCQFARVFWQQVRPLVPAVIYVDRRNVVFGAIMAWFGYPTVLRFHGINDWHRLKNPWSAGFRQPFLRIALKAPFCLVLSSEDGSAARQLFGRVLAARTPYQVLVNGVDKTIAQGPVAQPRFRQRFANPGWPLLLFVGRLTPDKGIEEFLQALKRLRVKGDAFNAIIVAGGSDCSELRCRLAADGLGERVLAVESLPHGVVLRLFSEADIYVSTNRIANLTNTVLEAIAAGIAVILLGADQTTEADISTEALLPDDVVVRIDRTDIIGQLFNHLHELLVAPERIDDLKEGVKQFASHFLWSWDQRIDFEISLLQELAGGSILPPGDLGSAGVGALE